MVSSYATTRTNLLLHPLLLHPAGSHPSEDDKTTHNKVPVVVVAVGLVPSVGSLVPGGSSWSWRWSHVKA